MGRPKAELVLTQDEHAQRTIVLQKHRTKLIGEVQRFLDGQYWPAGQEPRS
jgi:hypothetical protein